MSAGSRTTRTTLPTTIVGMRLRDLGLDERTGSGVPVVDEESAVDLGRLALQSPFGEQIHLGKRPDNDRWKDLSHEGVVLFHGNGLLHLESLRPTFNLELLGNRIPEIRSRILFLPRIAEYTEVIKTRRFDEIQELLVFRLTFARETR